MKFSTKAVHVGVEPDPTNGAIMPPIYMTSTFVQSSPGEGSGYEYTRAHNPNFTNLEKVLASLEGGKYATVFSSGLGALTGLLSSLKPGDKVIALDGLYGGTYRLFTRVFNEYGIQFEMITSDLLEEKLTEKPKLLLFETPTNPLLKVYDIKAITTLAKKHKVTTLVDNTFATPYFQNPLKLGADIVWHSTTKYLGGHSDVIGGVMIHNSDALNETLFFRRMALGLNPSPFDVWLTHRSVKTLPLRMEQHQKNAIAITNFLKDHPKVERIYYPGFSGMFSVEFKLSIDETKKLISNFKLFSLAESLGGVESLVNHPAIMTHTSIPREERLRTGVTDGLIRFSPGIEDSEDLIEDLQTSLK